MCKHRIKFMLTFKLNNEPINDLLAPKNLRFLYTNLIKTPLATIRKNHTYGK